ncbi:phospholipase D-like domain-containing protein [Rhodopirellula sp. JC639]|uniref:phospholipase D-like domain-containing protein n=1 Tax=Stieleria mannarensis TaxID=2755585 RepID=UPI0016011118|nr:phospholipase D-like domain-containing protein [Rhodopirellula sp. JC639]
MIWIVAYLSSVAGAFLSIVAMTIIRNDQRHSIGRIGWLGLILLSPPIGLILCLWLGGRKISAEHEKRDLVNLPTIGSAKRELRDVVERMLAARGLGPPTVANQVRLLSRPGEVRDAFMELIDGARETIHVMTFILDEKDTGRALVDRLCEKARQGVQVRLLVDGFGSFVLSEEQLEAVHAAGGKAARFKRMSSLSKLAYLNFRNHRKLAVADGRRAILGGANIVEEEVTEDPDDETWVDLSLWIEGPAASQLQSVFCSDWTFQTGEELSQCQFDADREGDVEDPSRLTVMPIGPDGPEEILDDYWQFAIHHATERLWICTPYFVPPPNAMRSLELACRRGIDVRVLVPQVSDLRPVDYARFDYFKDLIELGCKVYRYPDRMVHAKIGIVDDLVALVGSANFDVRSFFLNYELSVLVHDRETIQRISDWYADLAEVCERGTTDRSSVRSTLATAVRLFASEL